MLSLKKGPLCLPGFDVILFLLCLCTFLWLRQMAAISLAQQLNVAVKNAIAKFNVMVKFL